MNYKEDIKAMCLHSFSIRKMEGVHFNPPSPLSSSVLTPVKSLPHQVRQIAFQRLLPTAQPTGEQGWPGSSWELGRAAGAEHLWSPQIHIPRTRQAAVGPGRVRAVVFPPLQHCLALGLVVAWPDVVQEVVKDRLGELDPLHLWQ